MGGIGTDQRLVFLGQGAVFSAMERHLERDRERRDPRNSRADSPGRGQ